MSSLHLTVQFVPCQSNNMWQARQYRAQIRSQAEGAGFVVYQIMLKCIKQCGY